MLHNWHNYELPITFFLSNPHLENCKVKGYNLSVDDVVIKRIHLYEPINFSDKPKLFGELVGRPEYPSEIKKMENLCQLISKLYKNSDKNAILVY